MGLDLFNTTVESTYDGLLKTSDNDNITGVAKQITDGNGNNTPLWISTTRIGVGVAPAVGYDFTTNLGKFTTIDATTVNASFVGNLTGNADTATKWATARTITLNGDVSGSTSIDGSLNVSITAVVANDSHTHDTRYYTETEIDATLTNYQLLSEKGAALGYAPLDSGGKVAEAYLPDSVVGQVEYQGTWNATTNTPTLPDPTTVKGHFYIVSVAGNYLTIDYQVGDWVISNGVDWSKVDNTDAVTTFNGRLGSIIPLEADYSSFYVLKSGDTMTGNLTAPTFIGALSGNATTATTWQTARTLTIGDTGKTVDGSANVTWSKSELGITKTYIDTLNIDADTLDSLNSTDFLRSNATDTASGEITFTSFGLGLSGHYYQGFHTGTTNYIHLYPNGHTGLASVTNFRAWNGATYDTLLITGNSDTITWRGNTLLHTGNYTSTITKAYVDGLGVNADTVDGKHATDFTLAYVTTNGAITSNAITIGALTATTGAFSGNISVDDKITVTGTTNNLIIDESAANTWRFYDTFQNNGFYLHSGSGGMDFHYNGVSQLTIDGAGVSFTGTVNLDAADLNIGAADIIFDTVSTLATRGLMWDVDGGFLSKFIGGGTNGGMVELYTNMNDAITTGDIFRIKEGSVATTVFSIDGNGNSTFSGTIAASGYNDANWNTAYGWGNHALAGYLTSYTETDPIYVSSSWYTTTNNSANWNTAYGWGNWATGVTKTFVDALNVDATTLDSLDSSQFLRSDTSDTMSGELTVSNNTYISGNLAIGDEKRFDIGTLYIRDESADGILMRLRNTYNGGESTIRFQAENATATNKYADISFNPNTESLVFRNPYTTERMRIDSSGRVGIGVSPSYQLHNTGSFGFATDITGNIGVFGSNTATADTYFTLRNTAGRFDIGTSATGHYFYGLGSLPMQFFTNGSEKMRIDSSGQVGIGTTSPEEKLHVNGIIKAEGTIKIDDGATGNPYLALYQNGVEKTYFQYIDSSDSTFIQSDGYIAFASTGTTENFRMASGGDFHADGDIIAYSTTISDRRLKDEIETIPNALDKVKSMRGVSYVWNNGSRKGQKDLGLIAQEVEEVLPELVREKEMPLMDDSGEKYKTVDYEKMVGVLIEAIKEQQEQIDELKKRLDGSTN